MTSEREQRLQSERRRMLRKIVQTPRLHLGSHSDAELEPWVDWMVRATHRAETAYEKAGFRPWVALQQARKAVHLAKLDNSTDGKMSKKLLQWQPIGARSQGRPRKRWTD